MRVLAVIEVPKLFGRFILHSVRYAALIQAESPTNCDVHLAESVFQTEIVPIPQYRSQTVSLPVRPA